MLVAIAVATVGAGLSIWTNVGWWGAGLAAAFIALVAASWLARR
jgi:hypothetical protein